MEINSKQGLRQTLINSILIYNVSNSDKKMTPNIQTNKS